MKKKLIIIGMSIMLIIALAVGITACSKLKTITTGDLPADYSTMKKTDMSAVSTFKDAYALFLKDKSYKRTQYFSFESNIYDMNIKTVRKINGDKVYVEEVVIADGVMKLNEGKRFYYDGKGASYIYFNDKKRVPGKGEDDELYTVNSWDNYKAYDKGDDELKKELNSYRTRMVTYDVSSKDLLTSDSDDSVYTKDDKYYFTLIVDCSSAAMKDKQLNVAKEIADKLSGSPEDVNMTANTRIDVCVGKVDGVMKILALRLEEKYKGKAGVFSTNASQVYYSIFDYSKGAADITADDLLNLA